MDLPAARSAFALLQRRSVSTRGCMHRGRDAFAPVNRAVIPRGEKSRALRLPRNAYFRVLSARCARGRRMLVIIDRRSLALLSRALANFHGNEKSSPSFLYARTNYDSFIISRQFPRCALRRRAVWNFGTVRSFPPSRPVSTRFYCTRDITGLF